MNTAAVIWLVLMVAFLIAEASCPIHLISVWFAVGSLVATIVSLLGGPIWLQVVLFLAVSGGLLALLWPLVRKVFTPKLTQTNVDSVPGSTGLVTAQIDNVAATGQIKLNGMEWTARSTDGRPIAAGTQVKVDKIEGVKAFVSPVTEELKAEV